MKIVFWFIHSLGQTGGTITQPLEELKVLFVIKLCWSIQTMHS